MRNTPCALSLLLLSTLAFSASVAACSSSTPSTGVAKADAAAPEDAGSKADASVQKPDPAETCRAKIDRADCESCCQDAYVVDSPAIDDALTACWCTGQGATRLGDGGAGPCADVCASTACKSPPATPSQDCEMCIGSSLGVGGACRAAFNKACAADETCASQAACIQSCG